MGASKQAWGREAARPERRWRLTQDLDHFLLSAHGIERRYSGVDVGLLRPVRRWFRPVVEVDHDGTSVRLRGLRRHTARDLDQAISVALARHRAAGALAAAVAWRDLVNGTLAVWHSRGRWIPEEKTAELLGARPAVDPRARLDGFDVELFHRSLSGEERAALDLLGQDIRAWVADVNESILRAELRTRRAFFDAVEISPLTDEQARAVVCFDNRVQVVAAAGSGKTSVMVARAAYAIHRGFVPPERILLLAFNRAAAEELQMRLTARLSALGLNTEGLRAATFHSFGLDVIGGATGRKPRPAPWLADGDDVATVSRIVDELRDSSPDFRFKWDLFRMLYARVSDEADGGEHDGYDPEHRRTGFRTFRGEVVKSEGERMVADWLFLNGVEYRYEAPYAHDVADEKHSQYRPDFYYPDIDVWHEHWALGRDGKPPASFTAYAESMAWKKNVHRRYGTTLVETSWSQIIDGSGFADLSTNLKERGLTLDWGPDRHIPGMEPVKHEDLARLMRTFMTHVKSGSWTRESLGRRDASGRAGRNRARTRLFLDLYWQIHDAWEARLQEADCVDFEDMLVRAADHLEKGEAQFGYTLVMVDEFQDVSRARARLTRALVSKPDHYLLTVGDDWQSINRFAGSDLSVMTRFESWFGPGPTLRLHTTFRCPQSICDVSSGFVMKNQRQLRKTVRSVTVGAGAPVRMLYVADDRRVPKAIASYIDELAAKLKAGDIAPGRDGRIQVDVLGRYKFNRQLMPSYKSNGIDLRFRTIHGAKGLEADFVIVPNLTRGVFGFPSAIADDPVLDLVMAEPDDYPHAEERRLFYVALTRARREVALVAVRGKESVFVAELIKDGLVDLPADVGGGTASATAVCPGCGQGLLVLRRGPYGEFYGCNTFPRCRHTKKVSA